MGYHDTVFSQFLTKAPRHEIETLANQLHEDKKLLKKMRWSLFVSLGLVHCVGCSGRGDIVSTPSVQSAKLYHFGSYCDTRSSLGRVNESQFYTLPETLFHKLLSRCRELALKRGIRFTNLRYFLAARTIDICLSVFLGAKFSRVNGAAKADTDPYKLRGQIRQLFTYIEK